MTFWCRCSNYNIYQRHLGPVHPVPTRRSPLHLQWNEDPFVMHSAALPLKWILSSKTPDENLSPCPAKQYKNSSQHDGHIKEKYETLHFICILTNGKRHFFTWPNCEKYSLISSETEHRTITYIRQASATHIKHHWKSLLLEILMMRCG